jgi:hypothetical protein
LVKAQNTAKNARGCYDGSCQFDGVSSLSAIFYTIIRRLGSQNKAAIENGEEPTEVPMKPSGL